MSNNNYWGNITWKFLHTILEKIKEEEYNNEREKLLYFVKKICNNLPCPDCQSHANTFMKRVKITHVSTKEEFKYLLFNFHNEVNKKLKKSIQEQTILDEYKENKLLPVISTFIKIFSRPMASNRLMMDSMNRNIFMKELLGYLRINIKKFDE